MSVTGKREPHGQPSRIVIKFKRDIRLSYDRTADAAHAKAYSAEWKTLRGQLPDAKLQPLFAGAAGVDVAAIQKFEKRAIAGGVNPRLMSYYAIDIPPGADPAAAIKTISAWPQVELTYADGGTGPAPGPVNPADDPLSQDQGYLQAAPAGIDAVFAWTQADGSGASLVDLEQGWTLDHEDLPPNIGVIGTGLPFDGWPVHGTAVLGIVGAVDNTIGCIGIAPNATLRVVSQWFPGFNTPVAIFIAAASMKAGDVLLIETTAPPDAVFGTPPAEALPANFAVIQAVTAAGITVLEPAGNSVTNIDAFNINGIFFLNRASPDFQDSGAIVVGAATSAVPHERASFSNFGSRVDCYAWGENITTCGGDIPIDPSQPPKKTYTNHFGGTSGATATVAGAALLLQSWRIKQGLTPYDPIKLRALLSNPQINTKSKDPPNDRIGVMPNLHAIIIDELFASSNFDPSRWRAFVTILFGIIQDGGGLGFTPGGGPIHVDPWGPDGPLGPLRLSPAQRNLLLGLVISELSGLAGDGKTRETVAQLGGTVMQGAAKGIGGKLAR